MTLTGGMSLPKELVQTVYVWGTNTNGDLGLNDIVNRSSPVQIGSSGAFWTQFVVGGGTNALKNDGTLWSWANGGLGYATPFNDVVPRSSPVQVGLLTNWSTLYQQNNTVLALKTDNTLWVWGGAGYGQVGLNLSGATIGVSSPTQIASSAAAWTNKLGGGFYNFTAIKSDGTLWTWGSNGTGGLGLNDIVPRSSPVQVGVATNWSSVYGTSGCNVGIKTDGTLWCWGANNNGQLGQNNLVYRSSPVQVGLLTNWLNASINSGASGPAINAIKSDGTLWTWGYTGYGSGLNDAVLRSSPVQIGSLNNWSTVVSSVIGYLAKKTDGTWWGWGGGGSGGFGNNSIANISSPVQVGAGAWTNGTLNNGSSLFMITSA